MNGGALHSQSNCCEGCFDSVKGMFVQNLGGPIFGLVRDMDVQFDTNVKYI